VGSGRLSQAEYQSRIDPIFVTPETEHLHNQLVVALYGNLTREMPDPELAPWVSTNDKPTAPPVPKPVTGDAAERRLKGEVMQLPNRDRRRIKDLIHNIVSLFVLHPSCYTLGSPLTHLQQHDRHESLGAAFVDSSRRPNRLADATPQTGMGNMSSKWRAESSVLALNPPLAPWLANKR
jgi:transcriptional coactivator HFI1/ADA1